jgi:hypothetical protein
VIVNRVSVPSIATILDGTSVETTDTPSNLNLTNGERLLLAPNSSAKIHQDRLLLKRGRVELTGSPLYHIETADFQIAPSSAATRIQVAMQNAGRVHVEAAGGAGEVRNSRGMLVAKLLVGTALDLQATASSSEQLIGIVRSRDARFLLTDEVTGVSVEMRGANLSSLSGRRVEITGSAVASAAAYGGASHVLAVSKAIPVSDDGGAGGPSADNSSPGPTPDPPPPPMTKKQKTTIIIVAGVAVTAGTIGGLWAAGVIGGSESVSQ